MGKQNCKLLEMSTLSPDSRMPRQLSYPFLHPPKFLKYPLECLVAGARVNWKANTNSFLTGPLGPLNHSLLTFRRALWVGISCLLHSTAFNASHCLLKYHPFSVLALKALWELGEVHVLTLTCPHFLFYPQPTYDLLLGWGILISFGENHPKALTEGNSYLF